MHSTAVSPAAAPLCCDLTTRRRQRRRSPLAPSAATQPERQQRGPPPPDAPPTPRPQPIKIDVFETLGSDPPPPAAPGADGPLANLLTSLDFSEPASFDGQEKSEYDPLRDGPLRYLGYSNELGEAFAAWLFPGGVPLSYAVAISYVLFDTFDKWQKTGVDARAKLTARPLPPSVDVQRLITTIGLERGLDTLVWQLIASVAAPGYTIHTVVAAANWLLQRAEESQQVTAALGSAAGAAGVSNEAFLAAFNKSVPTALGLLAIPFIVHPIDAAVHAALNATLRPAMRRYICQEAGGAEAGLAICERCKE